MWIDTSNARLALSAQRALRLQRARGTRLRAVQGTVWITIDNDPRDIVLDAGEDFVVDTASDLVVMPLGERATLDLCGGTRERAIRADAEAFDRPTSTAPWQRQVSTWLHGHLAPRPA